MGCSGDPLYQHALHKLMIVEMEFISLLMSNVLPKTYKEQGIWVNDPSQGRHSKFFSNLDIHQAGRKWFNIISYLWFWNVYKVQQQYIKIQYIHSKLNAADTSTKAAKGPTHARHWEFLRGYILFTCVYIIWQIPSNAKRGNHHSTRK